MKRRRIRRKKKKEDGHLYSSVSEQFKGHPDILMQLVFHSCVVHSPFVHPLTHSLIHSIHSFVHSLAHSLIHSFNTQNPLFATSPSTHNLPKTPTHPPVTQSSSRSLSRVSTTADILLERSFTLNFDWLYLVCRHHRRLHHHHRRHRHPLRLNFS